VETVVLCVAPGIERDVFEFLEQQFHGPGWTPLVMPATDVSAGDLKGVVALVAYTAHWPDGKLEPWMQALRLAAGPRKRLLALLPQAPHMYPATLQVLWNAALGGGYSPADAIAILDDFVAGRL
jgi:hypothetical protein